MEYFKLALWYIGTTFAILIFIIAILSILKKQKSTSSAFAWLLLIILIPYIGIPLYIIFGGRKLNRDAKAKGNLHISIHHTVPLSQATPLDYQLRQYNIPGATAGNKIEFCTDGQSAYNAVVDLIENAKEQILLTTFIFAKDKTGKLILEKLAKKAAQGVEIKLLLDDIGSFATTRRFLKPLLKNNGKVAYFMPLFKSPFHGRANLRNHRKILIADQKRVVSGGHNIANEYMGPDYDPKRWCDISYKIEGPAVSYFCEVFKSDWQYAAKESITIKECCLTNEPDYKAVAQVVPSGPDVEEDPVHDALLASIYAANHKFWVITPYFVPDDALMQGLKLAVKRNVDVRILVPLKSDHAIVDYARASYLRELSQAGVKVFKYPKMVHAKAILADNNTSVVGSANVDMRSLFLNYEIVLMTYSKPEIKEIEEWATTLFDKGTQKVTKSNSLRDILEGLARLFSPLM